MGKVSLLSRLFIKAGQKNYLKQFKEASTRTFAGTITLPHFAQFNLLKNKTNLSGKKLTAAYVATTAATPVFIATMMPTNEASQNALNNSIWGGTFFGPVGSAVGGFGTLNNEADKIDQRSREEYEEEHYIERRCLEDEDFRREYEEERRKELEEESEYDEFA